MRYICYGLITLFWLAMTFFYVEKEVIEPAKIRDASQKNHRVFLAEKIRLRLEKDGQVIGRIDTEYRPQKNGTCMMYNRVFYKLNLGMLASFSSVEFKGNNVARMDQQGEFIDFSSQVEFTALGKKQKFSLVGEKIQGQYNVTITRGTHKYKTKIKNLFILPGNSPFGSSGTLEVGQKWQTFDQMTQLTYKIEVHKKGTYFFDGKNRPAFLLWGKLKNSPQDPFRAWVDPQGQIYRAQFPDGRRIIREPFPKQSKKKKKAKGDKKGKKQ